MQNKLYIHDHMVHNLYLDQTKAGNKKKIVFPTLGGTTAKLFSEKKSFPKQPHGFAQNLMLILIM